METESVLEAGDVVIARFVRIRIGRVQADSEIGADDQIADVVTQSEARSQSDFVEQPFPFEFGAGTLGVLFQQPDVARVEENSPVQPSHDAEAVFDVGLQLEVAGLVQIAVAVVCGWAVAARTQRPDREGPDAVGSADIELFAVGHHFGVAVGVSHSDEKTGGQPVVAASDAVVELHFAHLLDELREAVAEQMLRLFAAEQAQDARKDVAGRGDAVLPVETAVAGAAVGFVEGVGVVDRRNELVAETHGDRRILVHRLVESFGRVQQFVVGQLEYGQRMAAVGRSLEIVARRAAEGDQPEEAGAVHQVHAQLERRAAGVSQPARCERRQQQPRNVEVGVQSQFVGVEPRRTAPGVLVARLPFVRAVQLHGEHLAAPEEVVVADLEGDARTDEAVRLGGYVGLQRRFQRIVELGVDDHVQRVGAPQRVERRDAQIDRAENAQFVEGGLRAVLSVHSEELAGFERERPREYLRAYFHRPLGDDPHVPQAERIGRTGLDVGEADRDVPHAVGFEGHLRDVRFEVQPQVDPSPFDGRVGEVFHVFGPEIIIAPVAQQLRYALAFERQRVHVVLRPDPQQGGRPHAVDQGLQAAPGLRVGDVRVVPRRRDAERIIDLGLSAVLAVEQGVFGLGAEITVVFEHLLGDFGPQSGLYLGDQHGLFGQPFVEPVFESLLLRRVEVVVGPKADRQRRAEIGAVKRVVRGHGERLLHGRFGRCGEHDARIGFDPDLPNSRV